MSNIWFTEDTKIPPKVNQVNITIKSWDTLNPIDKELQSQETKVPGTGIYAWFLRAFYYVRIMAFAHKWILGQIFSKHNSFSREQILKRTGGVAVITGGARGIGTEIVKKLMIADMNIIIGCRDIAAGQKLIKRLRDEGIRSGVVDCMYLELESLDSVAAFANRVLKKYSAIHLLINNAGIMISPFKLTEDGIESQLQINYLSHLKLSILLTPALEKGGLKTKYSRIINVTSRAQEVGEIDFKDLLMRKMYSRTHAYACSKLMQVVTSNYLDAKFKANGLKIHSHSAHPGVVYSELFKHQIAFRVFRPIFKLLMQSLEYGADGIVYAALSPDIESDGGLYLGNSKPSTPNPQATDTEIQKKLWNISCELIGLERNVIGDTCRGIKA